jgi:ribose transport system substrate-binding protein
VHADHIGASVGELAHLLSEKVTLDHQVHVHRCGGERGTVCIQSGAPASLNLDDRIQGIRDTLAGVTKAEKVARLTGQGGWTEPAGCPVYNNDSVPLAAQQMFDVLTANPKLAAFVAVGGWAQYAPQAYRQATALQKDRVASKDLAIVFGDNFGPQMPLLKDGLSDFNVGQRPFDMAFKAIELLDDLTNGKTVPPIVVTGLEVCTPQDTATCGKTPSN